MKDVTIRELRNQGGKVIDQVMAGESMVITRSGRPVAELRPLRRKSPSAETLLRRWRVLPLVDAEALKRDLDDLLDPSL